MQHNLIDGLIKNTTTLVKPCLLISKNRSVRTDHFRQRQTSSQQQSKTHHTTENQTFELAKHFKPFTTQHWHQNGK